MAEPKMRHTDTSPMSSLPLDVLFNILIHLPVECLLRLKTVCKSWYFLITSPAFTSRHLNLHSFPPNPFLVFSGQDNSLYSLNIQTLESTPPVKIPFPSIPERISRKTIAGSCNGLLLCICDETPNFEALLLSSTSLPCKRVPKLRVPFDCLYINFGLGFDSGVEDYKVVRVVHFLCGSGVGWETMVYSLTTDSWKLVKNNCVCYGSPKSKDGVLLNNSFLHWLFWNASSREYCIGCFDVCKEEWSEVPMPDYIETDGISDTWMDIIDMDVLDGCFCLLIRDNGNEFPGFMNLWVMKEYRVKESWVKLFNLEDLCYIGSLNIAPIAYCKERDEILLRRDQFSRFFWYNLSEKTVRDVQIPGVLDYRRVGTCIQTLIRPYANGRIGRDVW